MYKHYIDNGVRTGDFVEVYDDKFLLYSGHIIKNDECLKSFPGHILVEDKDLEVIYRANPTEHKIKVISRDMRSRQYKTDQARYFLPKKRCWCLLKINDTYQPFVIAQWDPVYKEGSWILTNETKDVLQPETSSEYVEWFVILEE